MENLKERYRRELFPYVQMPAQYAGGEWNATVKEGPIPLRVALVYPDVYSRGAADTALQRLYHLFNRRPDVAAERAFVPEDDMAERLRTVGLAWAGLETGTPLAAFDVLWVLLPNEQAGMGLLTVLDRAGIPLDAAARDDSRPLVVASGPASANPEPLADFLDAVLIGEEEEAADRLLTGLVRMKQGGAGNRREKLLEIAKTFPSIYVPSLYRPEYGADGRFLKLTPLVDGVPEEIVAAEVQDFENAPFPLRPVVPYAEVGRDRIGLELLRGGPAGERPVRFRTPEKLETLAEACYQATGYDEIALLCPPGVDYPHLEELALRLDRRFRDRKVTLSFPGLRAGDQVRVLAKMFAPEKRKRMNLLLGAATDRLRARIDPRVTNAALLEEVREGYRQGWELVHLRFWCGLPDETPADVEAIASLSQAVSELRREAGGPPAQVQVTVTPFVPKPGTAFESFPMRPEAYFEQARSLLKQKAARRVQVKFLDWTRLRLEGILARGDRRLGKALRLAWERGGWDSAFQEAGVDPDGYLFRELAAGERRPWSHIRQKRHALGCVSL